MARCTKEEAQETRKRILDAAEEVFHEQGVTRTALEDIAQAAGVTRGAIYWHFKNKNALFHAMCERVREPMEAMVQAGADEEEADPLGRLRDSCLFVLREVSRDPHARKVFGILFHRCEYVEAAGSIMSYRQQGLRRGADNIERILNNAVARKQLPASLDTSLAAIMFQASWSGLLNNWLFSPKKINLARDAERFVDACIDNLRHAASLRQ